MPKRAVSTHTLLFGRAIVLYINESLLYETVILERFAELAESELLKRERNKLDRWRDPN